MGSTNVIVGAELRDWLISRQIWREGIYIVGDRAYGGDGKHYLDILSDKLELGFHGLCAIVVESGHLRFRTRGAAPLMADLPLKTQVVSQGSGMNDCGLPLMGSKRRERTGRRRTDYPVRLACLAAY